MSKLKEEAIVAKVRKESVKSNTKKKADDEIKLTCCTKQAYVMELFNKSKSITT